ncbi:MFS transporter [Streptomyces acidiscabies]|uniref:MFS transporter n=1 Tax=Streptomyces acidiscabies TaxID=42234 RepID=UPI0009607A15|nr:MFS transporter [Streptomyces acidiscabies]GAV38443.1 enterobactin exporter EntS [Streptomyces acidiscabies]
MTTRGELDQLPAFSRVRDFRLLWTAGAIDGLGTHASVLVLPLTLLGAGYPSSLVGLLATTATASGLAVSPFAGVLADRWPRKPMMIGASLVAAAAMGTVFAAVAWDRVVFTHLLAAAVVEQTASACYLAAAHGTVRRLVPPADYPRAIGSLQARDQATQIVGPAFGGVLYQLARWVPFLADALSFLLSAALVRAVRAELSPERDTPGASFRSELAQGIRFVWTDGFLRFVLLWTAGLNAVLGALYYHAVFSAQSRGASASSIGLILTFSGVGGLVGALGAPWLVRLLPRALVVAAASWIMVPAAVGLAFTTTTWGYGLLLGAVSLTAPSVVIVLHARAVLVVPDTLQARVGTVLGTAGEGLAACAPLAAGVLVSAYGGRTTGLGCAGALALLALYATFGATHLRADDPRPEAEQKHEPAPEGHPR